MTEYSPNGKADNRPKSTRAVVYTRVSTDAQERDGTSLETQERECLEHARIAGWQVTKCLRDTASGFTLDRPGIDLIRDMLAEGTVEVVIAYAVDRLSRRQSDVGVLFNEVQQAGARLDFVTEECDDSAMGYFMMMARSFVAEAEREKIAERTMRGKGERARQGRIPQGNGKGIYGYTYNRESGHREINEAQAVVVQRIFQRYAETRNVSAISRELNDEGIPALMGGRWYTQTIRNMLDNESYAGRFVYRRTKRVKGRSSRGGHRVSRVIECPAEDRIAVEGCTPRIVDEDLWQRVQDILNHPERTHRQGTLRSYPLRGRIKCGACGAAMVGQTLTSKGKPYKYYRCRHVYDNNTGHACSARYVRGDQLEEGVWSEVTRALADPQVVLKELKKMAADEVDTSEVLRLETLLADLGKREERLVRMCSLGDFNDMLVQKEMADISSQRKLLMGKLDTLKRPADLQPPFTDPANLTWACTAVARWPNNAGESERELAFEALQVAVVATKDNVSLKGVLP